MYLLGAAIYILFMLPPMLSSFEFNDMPHRGYVPYAGIIIMLLQIQFGRIIGHRLTIAFMTMFIAISAAAAINIGGFYSDGIVFWKKVLADNPEHLNAYYQIINIQQYQGDYAGAAETAKKIIDISPDDSRAIYAYAENLYDSGNAAIAEKEFVKAIEKSNLNPAYVYGYGTFLKKIGRLNEAETQYKKAISIAPDNQNAHLMYADYLLSEGRWQEAEKEYLVGFALKSENINLDISKHKKNCAYAMLKQAEKISDNDKFIAKISEAVSISSDAEVYESSAYLLLERGYYDASMKLFILALQTEPGRLPSALGAAVSAAKIGDFEKSKKYALIALKIEPENAKAKEIMEKIIPYLKR